MTDKEPHKTTITIFFIQGKGGCESWVTVLFLFFPLQWKEEGRRRGSGVIVTVAIFVPCQLFGVVVVETAFVTFDGAGLDLANLVTL
mmetsp:Transcript_16965/g.32193  ORF Transcript_16965/g.32193 Transcript_16965/m.32193 type:complete len:87 (+) Transcript_16965:742-1002(+)